MANITKDEEGRVTSVRHRKGIPPAIWVAVVGAIATISAALFYNWDNVFPA